MEGRITRLGPTPDAFDLEDAVVGVHFLLTGVASGGSGPLAFLVDEALGPRTFTAAEASAIADAVESIVVRVVRARLDSDALAALPPFDGRRLADDDKEWLLAVLQGVMAFMRGAASETAAVQITLS